MRQQINRLFADRGTAIDKEGRVAIQCQVQLKSGFRLEGALAETPEGCLRLMAPAQYGTKPVLSETFFAHEDVESVMFIHEAPPTSSIIRSS
jgi:hypothetical protein